MNISYLLDSMANNKRYTMKVVAQRTGLSPHAIRVWEKRYNAVTPERTDTNRRLYSDADIARLTSLHRATLRGHSIGRLVDLTDGELNALLTESIPQPVTGTARPQHAPLPVADQASETSVQRCLNAISNMDSNGLSRELMAAEIAMGRNRLLISVIDPVMNQVGEMWSNGTLRVADEHLATSVIRTFLGTLHSNHRAPDGAPLLISTTPSGQWHEIGALLASLTAQSAGWNTLYLGPNLPAEEIAGAAYAHAASAIALSIIYPGDDGLLSGELDKIHRALPDIPLLIGGRAAFHYKATIETLGAYHINSLSLMPDILSSIASSNFFNRQNIDK